MIRTPISSRKKLFLNVLSIVVLLSAYTFISNRQLATNPSSKVVPSVVHIKKTEDPKSGEVRSSLDSQLLTALVKVLTPDKREQERWLVRDTKATFYRLFIAFTIAIAAAYVFGLAIGCFPWIEAIFDWPLTFFSKITPTGALSVFFFIFGTDTKMFVAMIVFGILPAMIQSIAIAVKQFSIDLQNKGYSLGASNAEIILTLIFRYVLPNMIDAIKACIGPAMIFLIAAETLCADVGFGSTIRQQARLQNMDIVFIYLGFLAVFGFAMDFFLKKSQLLFCKWYTKEGN